VIRVVVVNRDLIEAGSIAARLCSAEIQAEPYNSRGTRGFRHLRAEPPNAIVIDLALVPSYGRVMGAMIRENKSLRTIPLVFIEGDPEKTAKVRATLPDAVFAPWTKIADAIHRAIRRAPAEPLMPVAQSTLLQKLGIREGSRVALLHAPKGFALPKAAWTRSKPESANVILAFFGSIAALGHELPKIAAIVETGMRLWIAWPKRAGSVPTDLSMPRIGEMARPYGLATYKTCSLGEKWSAMVFGRSRAIRR
jgi:hypothetical protein